VRDRVRSASLFFLMALLLVCLSQGQTAPSSPPAQTPFTAKTASEVIMQFSQALQAHIETRFLALFDLKQMKGGPVFRQQINLFFSHTDYIRIHLNLVDTKVENERATLTLDAEMEAQPMSIEPPGRRSERLTLVVARSGGSWKIVDVQPRYFFSFP